MCAFLLNFFLFCSFFDFFVQLCTSTWCRRADSFCQGESRCKTHFRNTVEMPMVFYVTVLLLMSFVKTWTWTRAVEQLLFQTLTLEKDDAMTMCIVEFKTLSSFCTGVVLMRPLECLRVIMLLLASFVKTLIWSCTMVHLLLLTWTLMKVAALAMCTVEFKTLNFFCTRAATMKLLESLICRLLTMHALIRRQFVAQKNQKKNKKERNSKEKRTLVPKKN